MTVPTMVTKDENGVVRVLALDNDQFDILHTAAELLPVHDRPAFMRSVIGRLNEHCDPINESIEAAIEFVLACRGVSYQAPSHQSRRRH
jgi:hypothetical protein